MGIIVVGAVVLFITTCLKGVYNLVGSLFMAVGHERAINKIINAF